MKKPNPGSDEALGKGCKCPVLDNNHGTFAPHEHAWWINPDCLLHGKK